MDIRHIIEIAVLISDRLMSDKYIFQSFHANDITKDDTYFNYMKIKRKNLNQLYRYIIR